MGIQGDWISEDVRYKSGNLKKGRLNLITDVPGVFVGHCTLQEGNVQTGVTAILPHTGDIFHEKCIAAAHVINGFGKSTGLIQVQELGTLETPILLTNTFAVGTASNALIRYMLACNEDIGVTTGSVNPVVLECNDSWLNDIRGMHIREEHAAAAINEAIRKSGSKSSDAALTGSVTISSEFEEGAVGAGTGMRCYKLKGDIGSASRILDICGDVYTLGALVLTNFDKMRELVISGRRVGEEIRRSYSKLGLVSNSNRAGAALYGEPAGDAADSKEMGSIIIVIATDLPLSARQLGRAARRAQNGIARTGSITGNDSGEIVVAFSTANKVSHYPSGHMNTASYLHEEYIDAVFQAVCDTVEESIISSLVHARTNPDTAGNVRSLSECLKVIR